MPNDNLKKYYSYLKSNGADVAATYESFANALSDENNAKKYHEYLLKNGFDAPKSYDIFSEKLGIVKKKETTVLPSVQKVQPISSGTQPKATQKPLATSVSKNKQVEVFTNFPTKEDNEYRIVNNNWQRKEPGKDWTTVRDSNAIIGLNKQYKKNIVPNEGFEGISSKLIDNSEETVVPYLQRNYGNLGFKFEQTGVGDRVRVLTEDGKNSEVFTLDNWTDEGDSSEAVRLKAWLKENTNTIQRERYNKIDSEISSIKNAKPKEKADLTKDAFANMSAGIPEDLSLDIKSQLKLKEKEKEAMQYNKSRMNTLMDDINKAKKTEGKLDDAEARARVAAVYGNKDEIAKQNRYINNSLNDIARVSTATDQRAKEYDQEVVRWQSDLEQNNGIETPELAERKRALEGRAEMINKEITDLDQNLKLSKSYQSQLDDIAGEYMLFKESKGSTGGAMVNNFIEGATNLLRFAGLERSSQEELIKAIGSDYTTKEYTTSKERSDIEKVLFSLSNSIGAAVGGGGVATPVSFFAQSYYDVKDEMDDNPDFNSVPELEKTLVAGTIGAAVGFLEKFGLDKLMSKSPIGKNIVNRILLRSVKDLPKKATAEMLEEAINSNMKRLLAKGAINIAGGMIVEGSTEFAQELVEGGIKELYNEMKNKEMFQSPDSLLAQSFEAAYLGAMGGAVMQAPVQSANVIATGLSNKNKLLAEILEKSVTDSELRSMMTSKIKTQILNGEITKEEGQKQLDAVNEAAVTFDKLPDNITEESRSKSFDLLIEKSKIEKEIAGKDENLVSAQKARIADINNELKTISENAVKESTKPVEEVTTEGGGVQYQGTQEGQPEVREGERTVGQAAQPEADLGNRAVEGRSEAEIEASVQQLENYFNENTRPTEDSKYNPDLSGEGELALREQENSLIELGADRIQAHGLTKGSIGQQFKDLLKILTKGLDTRGGGQLYTAPLVIPESTRAGAGAALGTSGGTAYMDGGFIILARDGVNEIRSIDDIGGVLVNQAVVDTLPELVNRLKESFPNLSIDSYSNATNVVSEIISTEKNKTVESGSIKEEVKQYEFEGKNYEVVESKTKDTQTGEELTVFNVRDLQTGEESNIPFTDIINKGKLINETVAKAEQPVTETEQKIITNLEQKINEYESKQATEGIGTEETVTTDEGKQVKTIKLRTPKNTNTKVALAVETGTNPRAAVLKYFVSGGKINSTAIQKLFGNKQGKSIKGEVQGRIGLINNKNGKTAEQIAEYLWSEYGEQFNMNDQDFLPYVEEVISEFKGTKGMIDELLSYENKSEEDYYKQKYGDDFEGYDTSELEDAESVLDYMTDDEIIQMANEIEASERETVEMPKTIDKAINYLEDLEKKLKDFGKGTLGINIPVVVLQKAVSIAKKSLQTGKQLSEAIDDAIKYVKSTYDTLTDKESKQIESNINDLFTGKKTFEDITEVKEKSINQLSELITEDVKDINKIISISKENNFSDNTTREYLKQKKGLSDKEATNAINRYNAKKEDIFIKRDGGISTKIVDSIQSFKRRMFSARAFLPKSVFGYKENKEADIARNLNIVDLNVKDFNRLYKKYKGDKEQLLLDFDAYIRGDKNVKLPKEFLSVADSMRNQIDNLSRQLIDNGLVDADMAQTIKDNMGQYLTRSYKIYDRANWKKEVEEEVKQKARNFLRSQYRSMAEELAAKEGIPVDEVLDNIVDNKMDEMLTTEGASNFITGSKLGAKDLSVLKERQDIPFEIRALMGEYSDPALNYAKTVLKLSSLAANHKFLTEVKNAGMGVYLFEKNDPRRPKDFNTMIAAEGSKGMNPLNGLYTTKEIASQFEAQSNQLSEFMKLFMKFQSSIRWAKTIGSVATHMKNVIGNLGFVWTNGHFEPAALAKAYTTVRNDFSKINKQDLRDRMNNYISLGIVKQSAGLGEIKDMFKDANWDTAMASRLSNERLGIIGKAKRFFLQKKKVIEDAYQAEDDFFKIIAYENELSRYSEAMFNKNKNNLTEEELKEVNKVVTEIVKNTYPTYDRIPEAIKMIRRAPFIGNFVSFQAEAYRTAWNTMILAKNELASDNAKIKSIGAKRLLGATSYISAKTAILQYFSMAAGTGLTGVIGYLFDDDDEEKRDKDIREFVAPWSKESDLIVIETGNGKIKYIDFTASDPHGGIKKVINSFLQGESTIDSFIDGAISTISPFIGEEMTTEALLELKNNQDKYGKQIWNPEDDLSEQSKNILSHVYKLVEPGTFSSIRRGISSENKGQELIANITGFRVYDVDVNEQFGFKMRDYSERIKNAKKIYNSSFYNEEATADEKEKAYENANKAIKGIYKDIINIYNSAERLGVKPESLYSTMSDFGGIAKYKIEEIQSGKIEDLKRKEQE